MGPSRAQLGPNLFQLGPNRGPHGMLRGISTGTILTSDIRNLEKKKMKQRILIIFQELSELAMGTYKHIGRIRSARLIGRDLADFYM